MQAKRNETELKLIVPADFELPALKDAASGVAAANEEPQQQLSATYYDTQDLRLMRHGITLRYRTGEDNGPLWTLKLPANGDLATRSELEFAGEPNQPPAEARDLLFAFLTDGPLSSAAEIRTKRRRWSLAGEDGSRLAELVDDRVSILDGARVKARFREIEIEADTIDRKQLEKIAARLRKAGGRPEQRSKASRALEALHKLSPEEPTIVSPKAPAGDAVRPALIGALQRILTFDPYARLGEVEGVHQLRIAARRLRSVVRTFAPIMDEAKIEPVVEDLRWLGQVLGAVRDLDVLERNLREEAGDAATPVIEALRERREKARTALHAALNSDRYVSFLQRVKVLTQDDALVPHSPGQVREVLPELVWRIWKKLRKAGRALTPESAEADFHRGRILAKRARYSAETIAPYMPSKQKNRLEDFAKGAESVQDVLGEHQDAAYARNLLLELAAGRPDDGALAASVRTLVQKQNEIESDKRKEFFDVWEKVDRKKNTKWGK
ncbi:MAG: CYTH and CHAD domain-containing protein [Chloroflexota bacterium]